MNRRAARLELFLATTLALNLLMVAYLGFAGEFQGAATIPGRLCLIAAAALAIAGVILLALGHPIGRWCCLLFYAMQVVQFQFPEGPSFAMNFGYNVHVTVWGKSGSDTFFDIGASALLLALAALASITRARFGANPPASLAGDGHL